MMDPSRQLVHDLSAITRDLLRANGADLEAIQQLIDRRAALVDAIAKCDTHSLRPEELPLLRSALHDGNTAVEKLVLVRRGAAAEWHRLNRLRDSTSQTTEASISLRG